MDLNKVIQRVRLLLVSPRTEWSVIAAERATVVDLYREYIMVVAAVPAICQFIKSSILGYGWHGFSVYRVGMVQGLTGAIVEYIASLLVVYVVALIIEAQAPNFAGQPDRVQALKAAGYSFTASWIAGLAQVLPGLYGLFALAGAIYSAYLLYLGLPGTMKVSSERAGAYTAVTVVVALLLAWVVSVIVRGITGISVSDG